MKALFNPLGVAVVVGLGLAGLPARAGGVVIVDAPGLGVMPDIQTAVSAAAPGDVLLVQSGTYTPFVIDNKSLYVFALPNASVSISGTIEIKNLAPAQRVVLSGLKATGLVLPSVSGPGLSVADNLGHVRLQKCTFIGGKGKQNTCYSNGTGGFGAQLLNSTRVAFVGCTLNGGEGYGNYCCTGYDCIGGRGGDGLTATGATAALYDSTVQGGAGGEYGGLGGHGGNAVHQFDFGLFAANTSFTGGNGGDAWDFIAAVGGDGGDALVVESGAQAQLLDNTFTRGAGGSSFLGATYDGQGGQNASGGGIFNYHVGSARTFTAPSIVSEAAKLVVTVNGEPGDVVLALEAQAPAWVLPNPITGVWLIPTSSVLPSSAQHRQVIGASGTATLERLTQTLTAPPSGRVAWLQGFVNAFGAKFLSSPMHVLVLDRTSQPDCDGNGVLDWLDLVEGRTGDCDKDLSTDACEIALGATDCNNNGVPDACDLASGTSQDGNLNGIPDDCEPTTVWHVDLNAAAGGNGSVQAPFQTLADAFLSAINGDTILVHDGVYTGPSNRDLHFNSRSIVVRSANGAASCVIDCESAARAFQFGSGAGPGARLEGLTIRNARASRGALNIVGSSQATGAHPHPTLRDCVFEACVDTSGGNTGGAFSASNGGATAERCRFVGCSPSAINIVGDGGTLELDGCEFVGNTGFIGGAVESSCPTTIRDCRFEGNSVSQRGGAIYCYGSFVGIEIQRCIFVGNTATTDGGAIYTLLQDAAPIRIDGCFFERNSAQNGGAMCSGAAGTFTSLAITNSLIVANHATQGGGLFTRGFDRTTIRNSIFWSNTGTTGAQIATRGGMGASTAPDVDVAWCDIEGGSALIAVNQNATLTWGPGNIELDPAFVDADGPDNNALTYADNDHHLGVSSPCIDAGDNISVPKDTLDLDGDANVAEPVPFDLDDNARFVDVVTAPDTGSGVAPLVDMGPYEHP